MKKKIILFLSFLLTAMFLTGCNQQKVRADTIEQMTQIVNNVISQKDYVVPDGYIVSDDNTTSDNIIIVRTTKDISHVRAAYEVSGTEVKLVEIMTASAIVTFGVSIICAFLIGVLMFYLAYKVINALMEKHNKKK